MLPTESATCPYCWESLEIGFDPAEGDHEFWEDCHVCCRPILFSVYVDSMGNAQMDARSDDD
ncbi:MAG: CPXCG motif-containing cysteine-rich protein [Litorivicinus sp.]